MELNINNIISSLEKNKQEGCFQYKGLNFSYDDFKVTEDDTLITIKFFIENRQTSKLNIFK